MPPKFYKMNLAKVQQIRRFKIDYSRVRLFEYTNIETQPPQAFAEFRRIVPPRAMTVEEQTRPTFSTDLRYLKKYSPLLFTKGKMLILVNYDLYPSIKLAINEYIRDLAYEGYFATCYRIKGGTPPELRTFIKNQAPIIGVLLVGSLPTAWFEMDNDFYGHGEFPCDLYYMDLDGKWNDPDNDGKFSEHPAKVEPEIWVGRLWTPTAGGNDAKLLNDYFNRNHLFRKGLFSYSNQALAYVDDDWVSFGDCSLDFMFPAANIEVITDPATTDGDRYKAEINQHRGWAQICAHSNPGGHSFKIPGGSEWVPNTYLRDVNPPNAYLYNLFACSNALFTQPEYMAGWYIFDKQGGSKCNGLAAVGSAKTGSMLAFENFYGPMAAGKVIGSAYVDWWRSLGNTHDLGERQWFYGMTLLGDPTINWWTGVVPELRNPVDGDIFDHYPRLTHFFWDPVCLDNASTVYNIEIDAYGAYKAGTWAAESGATWFVSATLTGHTFEHLFVGKQRGRWRVRARAGGIICPWSDWKYFEYKI